ncbi:hypothetical protein [Streptomyces sp. NPDC050704]|uniref:hypothetical protein n=1 Tax=Streptomyces sp. NPDC050704 TaxID=3157219 RepID=UPI003415C228
MSGKTWEPTKRGARDLERHIRKGTVVYTVSEIARNLAPYEDSQLYDAHTFTHRSPITGHWMTGHLSVQGLMGQSGTVYEKPPVGMRGMADPPRQVGAPLGDNYEGILDEAELAALAKLQRGNLPPKLRRALNAYRP